MTDLLNVPESVINTIIGGACGILVAYITARVRRAKPRSEYVDTAFSALEGVAKRTEEDNARLRGENAVLIADSIKKDIRISELENELLHLRGTS